MPVTSANYFNDMRLKFTGSTACWTKQVLPSWHFLATAADPYAAIVLETLQSADGSSPLTLSPEVLRNFISLQTSDLLSVERLRAGLARITRDYAREGYVDATTEADFAIDEDRGTVDVILKIDEQVQSRIGRIEFWGLNVATQEKLMQSLPKPGDIFDETRLAEFFKVNRAILPADVSSEDVKVRRDVKDRTVGILFDFGTCPQDSN